MTQVIRVTGLVDRDGRTGVMRVVRDGRTVCNEAAKSARRYGYRVLAHEVLGWGEANAVIRVYETPAGAEGYWADCLAVLNPPAQASDVDRDIAGDERLAAPALVSAAPDLAVIARLAAAHPGYVAAALARYQAAHGLDDAQLAAQINVTFTGLRRIALCAMPREALSYAPYMRAQDIAAIAAYGGAGNAAALERILAADQAERGNLN